ncbi:MAG: tetratricopeptide repeat protein [Anaerolineae bacterium]
MVSFLASQRDGMLGPNLQQALDAIGAHLENIRASWLWVTRSAPYLLNGDLAETYRRSIDAVWLYYDTRSLYKEGVALFETAVEGRPYHDVINPHTRALTAIRYGAMHGRLGAFDKAEQYLQIGIKEAEQAGWPLEINRGKVLLGFVYFQMGHNREAIAALEEALPVIREIGEPHDLAHCLLNLGFVRLAAGQPEDGARLAGESVEILRRIGSRRVLPFTLISLGSNLQNLGQIEQARDLFTEALQHARTIKTRSLQGYALMLMGINAQVRSALLEAREHFNAGHAIFSSIGDRYGLVTVLDGLNQIAYEMGDYEEAAHAGLEALRVAETAQMGERLLNSIFDLANAYTALGRFAEARALNERALEADVDIEQRLWGSRIGALNNLSEIARAEGDLTQARQRIDEAYDLVMQTDMEYPLAYVLLNRGRLAFSEGDLEAALSDGEAARTRFESFGLMRPQINARNLLVAVHARLGATDEARALLAPIIEQAAGSPYHPVKQEMLLAAAELMRAFGEREQAAALVGHVMTSETAWAEHKSRAARLLDALDLEADTRQRAVSRGEAASADDLLATVRTVVKK